MAIPEYDKLTPEQQKARDDAFIQDAYAGSPESAPAAEEDPAAPENVCGKPLKEGSWVDYAKVQRQAKTPNVSGLDSTPYVGGEYGQHFSKATTTDMSMAYGKGALSGGFNPKTYSELVASQGTPVETAVKK